MTQEQRESSTLSAVYMPTNIPDTPGEPSVTIPEEEVDRHMRTMTVGPEVDPIIWNGDNAATAPPVPAESLVGLMGLLSGMGVGATGTNGTVDPTSVGLGAQALDMKNVGLDPNVSLQAVQPEHLQQLLQQLTVPTTLYGQNGQSTSVPYGANDQWGSANQYNDSGPGGRDDNSERERWEGGGFGRGRGFRGRGRGRGRGGSEEGNGYRHSKRKPCSFFAAGRRALNLYLTPSRTPFVSELKGN